ncbi:hypothetical protein SLEP1_g49624 [Rubroshorea leprosula]|uniref:Uncharacterized protein n=1 Tax=Rubroshorea leprosula TaxID=152421 RepID=A0AAV5M0F6_9ROSI|nr:hypothetical protein SLEP1_g49624 [Rubroshorea leprosula]
MGAKGSSSRRPRQPTKRNMVWVRKEKNETVTQTLLKGNDQSPTSPKVASVIVSQDGVLKATFEAQEQSGNRGAESKEDGTIRFGEFSVNLSCLVLTLPLVFQTNKEEEPIVCEFPEQIEEEAIIVPAQDDKIVSEKPEEKMARHIRPLYINAHMDGTPISRVLVDNGAAVNVLPTCMLYKIGKSLDDLVHTEVTISDFTGGVNRLRGVLPVELTVGNKTLMSAFFVVDTVATYNALLGRDWIHSSWCVPSSLHQKLIFWNGSKAKVVSADDKPFSTNTHLVEARYYEEDIGTIRFFGMDRHGKPIGITACSRPSLSTRVVEEVCEEADQGDEITLEELDLAQAKLDDLKAEVQDPLEEINLGSESEPKVTFISGSLELQTRDQIVRLLHEFKDYFAWDYLELPATPKDEYPMPITDLLVDGVARHKILSFMDGHSGYNQIFIIDADVPKMAFRCPGDVGNFEWIVRPFGLKNAGATYQRAMNAIFHDMIGKFMEIYIDDVVVKSHGEADHLRGLEVDKNKARAVIEAKPPQNKKELQRFLGQKAVKGQALADFLVDHSCLNVEADEAKGINLFSISLVPWKLNFDGSSIETVSGARVVVISPSGLKTQMSFQLDFDCTNNQVEYEALIIGLEMLVELKVSMVEVIGDSQLVLKQLSGEYKCASLALAPYFALAVQLLEEFDDVSIRHVSRDQNYEANEMAQIASGLRILEGEAMMNYCCVVWVQMKVSRCCLMSMTGFVIHGPLQRVPASKLNSIVKPWPFRGWAIDLIGKVYPPSSKGHSFIIVATDYFTKWVKAKPMKKVDQSDVIKFIKEDIIHKFGLPETITTDQGTVFVSHQVEAFAKEMGFRLLNSTPHYAQANGQAEASNKVVINLLEKMVDDNPRRWHELLSKTLWAYRTSQRSSTKMTPFALTYGHNAVLPMELIARSLRIAIQHNLQSREYDEAMMLDLEDLEDTRLTALDRLQAQKLKIAKSYNKRVKGKNLAVGDLVWKAILPLGKKDHGFGKWSPNWEGPFRIHEVLREGAYWLESFDGKLHPRKINGIYLKPYYLTVWEARGLES